MRRWRRRMILSALVIFAAASVADAATMKNLHIGNWLAGAYSNDRTGEFSHCAASASYKSGVSLVFAINRQYTWSVGFANPRWKLDKGSKYPLALNVDGSRTMRETAIAISANLVEVKLADSAALFNAFKLGNRLNVFAAGQTFHFDLTDTSTLLPSLLQCVKSFKGRDEDPQSKTNPFVPGPGQKVPPGGGGTDVDNGGGAGRPKETSI